MNAWQTDVNWLVLENDRLRNWARDLEAELFRLRMSALRKESVASAALRLRAVSPATTATGEPLRE